MLKDIMVLEINGKKEPLGYVEVQTPSEFILANRTEQILNCHAFDDLLDSLFETIVEEIAPDIDQKINNVYATFIDYDDDTFVCSIVLDKLNPKRRTFRVRVIDWQLSEHTFKYLNDVNDSTSDDNLENKFKE